ncbi:transcriptional regulator [Pseudokineococcus basanitobsidens]|uniref:Transcriptional regulator n=1 Tax=Pseudokineococcus basanitobsidens TaxID=1926649 RepID=A0ABU8RHX7_9ACTN
MASEYAKVLGNRLRSVRTRQGLSLQGVEAKSQGHWKAVVVGSYERGDRAVTVQRLAELAEFYDVPVTALLPETTPGETALPPPRLVLDLERLRQVPTEQSGPLLRYLSDIREARGDEQSDEMPIRVDDLRSLAVIFDLPPSALTERLIGWGVLDEEARRAVALPDL